MIVSMQYEVDRIRRHDGSWSWAVLDTETGVLEFFATRQEARDACDEWNRTGEHS